MLGLIEIAGETAGGFAETGQPRSIGGGGGGGFGAGVTSPGQDIFAMAQGVAGGALLIGGGDHSGTGRFDFAGRPGPALFAGFEFTL